MPAQVWGLQLPPSTSKQFILSLDCAVDTAKTPRASQPRCSRLTIDFCSQARFKRPQRTGEQSDETFCPLTGLDRWVRPLVCEIKRGLRVCVCVCVCIADQQVALVERMGAFSSDYLDLLPSAMISTYAAVLGWLWASAVAGTIRVESLLVANATQQVHILTLAYRMSIGFPDSTVLQQHRHQRSNFDLKQQKQRKQPQDLRNFQQHSCKVSVLFDCVSLQAWRWHQAGCCRCIQAASSCCCHLRSAIPATAGAQHLIALLVT